MRRRLKIYMNQAVNVLTRPEKYGINNISAIRVSKSHASERRRFLRQEKVEDILEHWVMVRDGTSREIGEFSDQVQRGERAWHRWCAQVGLIVSRCPHFALRHDWLLAFDPLLRALAPDGDRRGLPRRLKKLSAMDRDDFDGLVDVLFGDLSRKLQPAEVWAELRSREREMLNRIVDIRRRYRRSGEGRKELDRCERMLNGWTEVIKRTQDNTSFQKSIAWLCGEMGEIERRDRSLLAAIQ